MDTHVQFMPQAVTRLQQMHSSVRELRGFYGDAHPVTTEAQSSFANSLMTIIGLGGTIGIEGDMLIGANSFGFTFGMVAHRSSVPAEYEHMSAPAPVSFSVNS
jgi:hypothetical protein